MWGKSQNPHMNVKQMKPKLQHVLMQKFGRGLEGGLCYISTYKKISHTKIVKKITYKFDVRKSVHHHTIQIIRPKRCNSFTSLLLDVYVWLNMFRGSPRPSSGAYNCAMSLWFYRWRAAAGVLLVVICQTTTNNAPVASLQR